MMVTTHVLTGGLVGLVIKNEAAFVGGVLLHFVADKIPHFWPDSKDKQDMVKFLDGLVAVFLLALFWFLPIDKSIFWGGLGGFVVDLILVVTPYFKDTKLAHWHTHRQPHKTEPLFLLSDGLLILTALLILGLTL